VISRVLVALQFGLIALVMVRFDLSGVGPWHFVLLPAGFAVGAWAFWTNRPDNINIRPEPKPGGTLVTGGPYRFVRHPMYLAVMLFSAGFVGHDPLQWLALGALAAVLFAKARREERLMVLAHPGYVEYRARTRAIIPFVL
jgi:protein-S-isoprenylcysteine O-methyltransferase Ste14